MRIAVLVAGAINTLDFIHRRNQFHIVDALDFLGLDYDVYVATGNESAFKAYPQGMRNESKNTIYGQPIIREMKENRYVYTIGRLEEEAIRELLEKNYPKLKQFELVDDSKVHEKIPLEGAEYDDAVRRLNHMYLFSWKMKRCAEMAIEGDYDFYVYTRPDAYLTRTTPKAVGQELKKFFALDPSEKRVGSRLFKWTKVGTPQGSISQKILLFTRASVVMFTDLFDRIHNYQMRVFVCRRCDSRIFPAEGEKAECVKCSRKLVDVTNLASEYKLYQHAHHHGITPFRIHVRDANMR